MVARLAMEHWLQNEHIIFLGCVLNLEKENLTKKLSKKKTSKKILNLDLQNLDKSNLENLEKSRKSNIRRKYVETVIFPKKK